MPERYQYLFAVMLLLYLQVGWAQKPTTDSIAASKPQVKVSVQGGFYNEAIELSLSFSIEGAKIYYTGDGTPPSPSSKLYTEPIRIESTQILQAIAIYNKGVRSAVLTQSYFIGERNSNFPIISLCINPMTLFDNNVGLFKKGPRASAEHPYRGANYYSTKEFPCHAEIFESPDSNGQRSMVFAGRLGFSIFGGMSRVFPQKSLALYARKEYGPTHITHAIFPDLPYKKYKRLVLRNSGSDYGETHFRDAFITSLGKEMGLEVQAYRPSLVFINGRYWGVLNIREKLTKHYFEQHFDIDKDSIDLLEHKGYVQGGTRKHYEKMQVYMTKNDLSKDEHLERLNEMMDIENFMEYQIIQIYIDNQDAGGNVKFWRPQKPDGRWRWVLFDTDFGFGHYSKGGYNFNTLALQTSSNGPLWPNPSWSTLNLRMLLKNKNFCARFVTRFCDRMNSTFESERVVARMDSMAARIEPEMQRHWERWELTPKDWTFRINQMRDFARRRPAYMRRFLRDKFPEIGTEVQLQVDIVGGGHLTINEVIPVKGSFFGYYFKNLAVQLKAQPYFGFQFSHWEINGQKASTKKSIDMEFLSDKQEVKAVFIKGEHPQAKQIIINEISCRDTMAGDWIEFYNSSADDLNLAGWILRDGDNNEYIFPNATIKAGEYLLLCREEEKFKKIFTRPMNSLGGLNFGLGRKKDRLELYTPEGDPVDSVGYKIGKSKDSTFLSLALRDFSGDNGDFEKNWKYDKHGGSPGSVNPHYLEWKNQTESASEDGENLNKFMTAVKVGVISTGVFIVAMLSYVGIRKIIKKRKVKSGENTKL